MSSESSLPRIGPGLGSRQRIWQLVQTKVQHDETAAHSAAVNNLLPVAPSAALPPGYVTPARSHTATSSTILESEARVLFRTPPTVRSPRTGAVTECSVSTPVAASLATSISMRERMLLQNLATADSMPTHSSASKSSRNSNSSWLEFIPTELIDIYYAIYDEMKALPISEKEIVKIDKDVPRTFGLFARHARLMRLNFPSDMSAYYTALRSILTAISYERGYCQGINFIVATMLIQYPQEKQVYTILAYLLKYQHIGILFDPRYSSLLDYMRLFEKKLRKHNKTVYNHFRKCDFTTVSYAIEWFTTCFIVSSPGEFSLCVLDLLIAGFDNIMIRVGLALLDFLEEKIVQLDFEGLHQKFKFLMTNADPIVIMANAIRINLGTNVNYLQVMAQKIESLDPSQGGNLQFARRSAVNGRRFRDILISPVKIDAPTDNEDEWDLEDAVLVDDWGLADDEVGVLSLRSLLRKKAVRELQLSRQQTLQQKLAQKKQHARTHCKSPWRSAKKNSRSIKASTPFAHPPGSAKLPSTLRPSTRGTGALDCLPSEPNSPVPLSLHSSSSAQSAGPQSVTSVAAKPSMQQQHQASSADPNLYAPTNVAQNNSNNNWWAPNSFKSSLMTGFRGIGKLFGGGAPGSATNSSTEPVSSTTSLSTSSLTANSTGLTISLPASQPSTNAINSIESFQPSTPALSLNDNRFDVDESEHRMSESDFSSDLSESKRYVRAKLHKHEHATRFTNRRLGSLLFENIFFHSSRRGSKVAVEPVPSGDVTIPISSCADCGCQEDNSYEADDEGLRRPLDDSLTSGKPEHNARLLRDRPSDANEWKVENVNIRLIPDGSPHWQRQQSVHQSESVPSLSDACLPSLDGSHHSQMEPDFPLGEEQVVVVQNSCFADVLSHHLHERWFNADGRKVTSVNMRFRRFHKPKRTLEELRIFMQTQLATAAQLLDWTPPESLLD